MAFTAAQVVFLKWAGGKRRILPLIEQYFPAKFDRYFEPFLGGGSVFFHVKQKYNPSLCVISDTNEDLINTYIDVRDNPTILIRHLKSFKEKNSSDFYYEVRRAFNNKEYQGIKRSAAFIYLNKTCFNGLYRVNQKNEFNVPYGGLKNPIVFEESVIRHASALLNDKVKIVRRDFLDVQDEIKTDDFVYLDPCYDPIKRTSFAHYTPERFSDIDRYVLHDFIEELRHKKAHVVLSNNDIPEIRKLYSEYNIAEILAPRSIGSKISYRSALTELVISTQH